MRIFIENKRLYLRQRNCMRTTQTNKMSKKPRQATVSQHIKQVREAGWLSSEAVCQMTYHWLDEANITWLKEMVGDIFE